MKRILKLAVTVLGVVLLLVGTAIPASAHAQLESTDPPQSSVLEAPPTQVVLHFGEPVEIDFGSLRVLGPTGQRVDSGGAHHPPGDTHSVAISLPKRLPRGTYVVAWRVISADSHPVHGAFVFSIGTASGAGKATSEATVLANQSGNPAVGAVYWFIRFAAFVGLLFLVGLAFVVGSAWRSGGKSRRVRRLMWASWWILLAATLLGIAIQGVYAAALPLGDIIRPSLVSEVLHTHFGKIETLRVVLLLAFIPVLLGIQERLGSGPNRWRWVTPSGLMLGVALLFTPGLAGHASTGAQPAVGLALDVAHLAAASVWLGGLALLASFLVGTSGGREQPDDPASVVRKVSAYAFVAVAVIVATGTYQSIRQVGSFYALFHTSYGRTLVVKIVLVISLIATGAMSRRIVHGSWGLRRPRSQSPTESVPTRQPLDDGGLPPDRLSGQWSDVDGYMSPSIATVDVAEQIPDHDSDWTVRLGRLRRTVLAEIAIALVVLAVTALLVNAVPAKQAANLPFSTSFTTLGVQVNAIVDPAKAGPGNQVHVYILSSIGTPKAVPELDVTLSLPAEHLGPLAIPLRISGPGHYYDDNVDIPVAGNWVLQFTIRTDAIDEQVQSVPLVVH